ncbi:hypothetical protein ACMU_09685 [Actibacterium mucosum KCTC 23349]|uniref:ABC transporter substrate-binding protein n=1 Tax=Actibacterium mucosum KCTC 23349 TaxID=1454373 RepID=A0A037ZK63_9RHOB|nr:extracellular solute-binding protein [Actibacterium mucosum]KAJ56024.1 hypothetical protein ACMU_09685 [Actibacterium mucosum KCTC 23349]
MSFLGLTWDHPRGYDALAEAARRVNAPRNKPLITWAKQPLEGFESAPIADLAARHDLLVLDHPHIGEAVAEQCLIPLEDLYEARQITAWQAECVGPSLASYAWNGVHWALPLDVATQVMAWRADRVAAPGNWADVLALAEKTPVAQSLGGPHAFLTLISIAAGQGHRVGGNDLLPGEMMGVALDIMHRLYAQRPKGSEHANPIQLLETMAAGHDIALIPLIFGYVTYARPGPHGHAIRFGDSLAKPGGSGGVLGGTGIAFTKRAKPDRDLLDHVAWLMQTMTQTALIPAFGGQPSARTAWRDADVNADWGDFYAGTLQTAETALLRPRFDGYIAFQNAAAAVIREALAAGTPIPNTIQTIKNQWHRARIAARGELDDNRGPAT